MRTHHIEVKVMLNPSGAVFATLDVTVGQEGDSIEFVYPENLQAKRGTKFLEEFEIAFTERLKESRNPGLPSQELRVSVVELCSDPQDSSRIRMAGCLAAIDLLKKEHTNAASPGATHSPPPSASVLGNSVHRSLDLLPAPASGAGR